MLTMGNTLMRRCEIRQRLLFTFLKILFRPLYFRPAT
jgi:hypothetical protein